MVCGLFSHRHWQILFSQCQWTSTYNDAVSANDIRTIQEERKAPGLGIEVNLVGQHSSQQYRHSGQHLQAIESGKAEEGGCRKLAQTKYQENTQSVGPKNLDNAKNAPSPVQSSS